MAKLEEERAMHEERLAQMEAEMTQVFQMKVAEKEAKLKQTELELVSKHKEMQMALERQRQELEENKKRLMNTSNISQGSSGTLASGSSNTKVKRGLFGTSK